MKLRWNVLFSIFVVLLSVNTIFAKNEKFNLIDKNCKVLGVENNNVKSKEASKTKLYCEFVKDNSIKCTVIDTNEDKVVSSSHYKAYSLRNEKGKLDLVIGSSSSGNIKFVINFSSKKYTWGQVNLIIDKGIILNKLCTGLLQQK